MPDADDHDHGDVEYGLVMPFVVCASKGGPYDDDSFVAGYEMGHLDAVLGVDPLLTIEATIHSGNAPQADLLALKHGFTMEAEPWAEHPDEWTKVTFRPVLIDGTDG